MKKFIYNEMMVHVPLCTHKEPKEILIISNDPSGLKQEVEKHTNISLNTIECSLDNISKLDGSKYDVVISEMEGDALLISQINRVLNENGVLVIKHPDLDEVEENKTIIQTLGNYFKIIMPYNLGDGTTALLCSHTYHPTADLILQRTDMLDGLEYYNCDIHPAAFAMGNNVRKAYLGIIKKLMAFKYAIALTGGIATGKSTVASLLALNGMRVIDADTISHQILDDSREWVRDTFGQEYINGNKVDRAKLGTLVFSDAEAKKKLENYLHPKIRQEITKQSEKQDKFNFPYLIDIPLFFENSSYDIKDSVVVYTPADIQLDRFMKRNGYSLEESKNRIASQMPIDEKKEKATWVIDNSKDLKHLQEEVESFVQKIKEKYL